jgi:hypothetical protein
MASAVSAGVSLAAVNRVSRWLLALSALLLFLGGIAHAAAFGKAAAVLAASSVPSFFGNAFKALWLIDSSTQEILALTFGLAALKPATATRLSLSLAALIPAATAMVIYSFLGGFFAGHLLMLASATALWAGVSTSR